MLEDYEDEDVGDYDDLLGGLSENDVEDVGAFMQLKGYELDDIIGDDLGASSRKKRLARAAKKIKMRANQAAIPSAKLYKRAKKRRHKRLAAQSGIVNKKPMDAVGFGESNMVCGVQPPCTGLLPKNEPVYDTERLSATQAAGDVTFFAIPEGQASSVSGSSITKSKYHTNMTAVKMLPVPQRFDVMGLSWCMDTATAQALNDIRNKCAVIFYIGNTSFQNLNNFLQTFFLSLNFSRSKFFR